ncbi:MAG: aminotransferase class I/II-fold pyridoxal phosphate-dependent enzyme [bacterium]|nr:aminotransferase class I/II-fold pyridoxal phosphate-dependent enzyme [bacterium]
MTLPQKVYFDRNENRYGPAPACLQVLREAAPELLFNYSRSFEQGSSSDLAARLARLHGVPEQKIILGYGCEDILKEAVHHFLPVGRAVAIPSASWWYYHAVAGEVGGVTVEYPLRPGANRYEYDVTTLISLREVANPALVLIASPNNPTGNSLGHHDLLRVLEAYRDVPVILDQAYHGFVAAESDAIGDLTREFPHLLVLRTFSKLHALAGVRIGYALCGDRLEAFRKYCARYLGFNRLSERLALAALDSTEYYGSVAAGIARSRQRVYEQFRSLPGCAAFESDANFVLVRMTPQTSALLERELPARGLIVKFLKEPGFEHHARISVGTEEETERLVACIAALTSQATARARALGESA